MNFNELELLKVKEETTGWFKRSARKAVSRAIKLLRPRLEQAIRLPEPQRQMALNKLIGEASAARYRATESGATPYRHPKWAAAAVCENWLQGVASGNGKKIARIERVVYDLENRG